MRLKSVAVGLGATVGILLPSFAGAQGTSCGVPSALIPDGRLVEATLAAGATHVWMVGITVGQSYSAEVKYTTAIWSNSPTLAISSNQTGSCPNMTPSARETTFIDPFVGPAGLGSSSSGRRFTFTTVPADASDPWYFLQITNPSGAPQTYTVSMSNVSQFSPAWSTFGSYNTFYSLYNTTNATCAGTLTLYDTAGVVADTQVLTVAPAATGSTNTQSMATPRNMAGTAKFTHDCPAGAFLAEAAIANFSISPTPYFQFVHFEGTREAKTH